MKIITDVQNHSLKRAQLYIFQGRDANRESPVSATPT